MALDPRGQDHAGPVPSPPARPPGVYLWAGPSSPNLKSRPPATLATGASHSARFSRPPVTERRIQRLEESSHGIAAHDRFQTEDLWNRRILSHPLDMREPASVRQGGQNRTLQHVIDRRGIRIGAIHRTAGGELFHDAYMFCIGRPRHKPSEGRQRAMGSRQTDSFGRHKIRTTWENTGGLLTTRLRSDNNLIRCSA